MRVSLLAFIAVLSACGAVKDSTPTPDAPVIVEATLTSITVTPTTATLKRRLSPPQQLKAMGTYSDETSVDITTKVSWTSSDLTAAMVTPGGLVSAAGASAIGNVTVTAMLDSKSGTAQVSVVDPTLVVPSFGANRIDFFPAFAEGNVAPIRSIVGAMTLLGNSRNVTVSGDELFVSNFSAASIEVFPVTGSGDIPPSRRIVGALTTLQNPTGIAVSATEIFVGLSSGKVLVFPKMGTGNIAPTREISGAATMLAGVLQMSLVNNELYVVSYSNSSVSVFPDTATGNVAPTRTIIGAMTTLSGPQGIAISSNEMLVVDSSSVKAFPLDANGNVAPSRIFTGTLSFPSQSYVMGNELYIANYSANSIQVYQKSGLGSTTAVRQLGGALTLIQNPLAMYLY